MLSVPVFVSKLLQAARSPELHTPSILDALCRIALDAHYASGLAPIGSIVPYDASALTILGTIQDALVSLRTAYSLLAPQIQRLTSASELFALTLSCVSVSDMSQIPTSQILVQLADVNELLHNFRLEPHVRQVLETFALSLSLLAGDDAKAVREVQFSHTMQLAFDHKRSAEGHSNGTDTVTFSLLFNHLVCHRADDFGSGDGSKPVALLVALFRWASWSPAIFYTQMFLSSLICLRQSGVDALTWKAFILGRLLNLLPEFEVAVKSDTVSPNDWKRAIQAALVTCLRQTELLSDCDLVIKDSKAFYSIPECDRSRPIFREILQKLIRVELVEVHTAAELDPSVSNDRPVGLQDESKEAGVEFEAYMENKLLIPEGSLSELGPWIDRLWQDPESHSTFAMVTLRRFKSLILGCDVEGLSHMCKIFYTYDIILDIMALHIRIAELISRALIFLDEYDCETVGDPQTAVNHFGDVVLFVQYAKWRFRFGHKFRIDGTVVQSQHVDKTDLVRPIDQLSVEDLAAFNTWFKALFDSNSEGIEDSILRSTKPKVLLKISATLFNQAIEAGLTQKIDRDTLNNGVSYFTGPILSWTLVGIVKALINEVSEQGLTSPVYLEIFQILLLSVSCPRPVIALCGPQVLHLLEEKNVQQKPDALRSAIVNALEKPKNSPIYDPNQAIQTALAHSRSGKAPHMDVDRCLDTTPPTHFLRLLWTELASASARMGETETCRRLATFALTMPRRAMSPPLLPIFMHVVVPWIISELDEQSSRAGGMIQNNVPHQQQPQPNSQPPPLSTTTAAEHGTQVELLVTLTSSVLTAALHLELAMHSVCPEERFSLGEPSSSTARRFATALRRNKPSRTSQAIAHSLAGSTTFVANFPMFVNELG